MPTPRLPLSRRRLLQIGGMAPALLLVQKGASAEEVAAAIPANRQMSKADMDKLVELAVADGLAPSEKSKFRKVVAMLWAYFLEGADPIRPVAGLPEKAYKYISGQLIVMRIGKFNDDGEHMKTNACAFLCGHYAARAAQIEDAINPAISETNYREGWSDAEGEMSLRLTRLRNLAARKGEAPPIGLLGNGC